MCVLSDADYVYFLETLKKEVEPLPSAEVYLEQQEANKQSTKGVFFVANLLLKYKPQLLLNQRLISEHF